MVDRHAFLIAIPTSTPATPPTTATLFTFPRRARLIGRHVFDGAFLRRHPRLRVFRHVRRDRFALRQRFDGGFRLRFATAFAAFTTLATFSAFARFTRLAGFARLPHFAGFTRLTRFANLTSFTRLAGITRFTRLPGFTAFTTRTRFACFTSSLAALARFPFLATSGRTCGRARRRGGTAHRGAVTRRGAATTIAAAIPAGSAVARAFRTGTLRRTRRSRSDDGRRSRLRFRLGAEQVLEP
jgi:hypothetical protein